MKSIIVLIKVLTKCALAEIRLTRNYEIDFVCKKMGIKIYVQLTRELTHEDTIERECRPLLMVKDNYPKISYQQMSLTCLGTE